jgi:hypothetical protein
MKKSAARTKIHKLDLVVASIDHSAPVRLPPALASIAAGRDHILTEEFARAANRATQTIRKNFCTTGECFGIRPVKFGNRLLWPVNQIALLLNNGASGAREPTNASKKN